MIEKKKTFLLGVFLFLVPFMGLPTFWKTLIVVLSGLTLVFTSITFSIPVVNKKTVKHRTKKEKIGDISIESIPVYPKDNILPDIVIKEKRKNKVIVE